MKSFYQLSRRHQHLLHSIAGKLLDRSKSVQTLDVTSLIYAGSWSHGDGERLHAALWNRMAYGHAHYLNLKGSKAERRLQETRWSVWRPIMDASHAFIIGDYGEQTLDDGAPWFPCPPSMPDYFQDVVPPLMFHGGFACGEAQTHLRNGEAVYLCFRSVGHQHYCRYASIRQAMLPMSLREKAA